MILKGSQRGGASRLARHLMNAQDNEHVELHELRGFVAEDLDSALLEAEAIAKGTRCKQFLFSLSLNPPETEQVEIEVFEDAADRIEGKLGLEEQPRAIVFHEKEGRRHAHVVWSRIDAETMTAKNLPFFKSRLMEVSKELYLEHGWSMPKGMIDRELKNPLNFSREEWQQAQRAKQDPRLLKSFFKFAWENSDSRQSFENALKERGFLLAKGDRRGFVAVDFKGEAYAIARYTGAKTKEVKARLGDPKDLPSIEEAKATLSKQMDGRLKAWIREAEAKAAQKSKRFEAQRAELVQRHRKEREEQAKVHDARWEAETRARAERLPKGFSGIWTRLTGKYGRIRHKNETEAWQAYQRDQAEKDELIFGQLAERQELQKQITRTRDEAENDLFLLRSEIAAAMKRERATQSLGEEFGRGSRGGRPKHEDRDIEPEL